VLDGLSGEPHPAGAVEVSGGRGVLRLRVAGYQLLYVIREDVVVVLDVGHWNEPWQEVVRTARNN
jgi:mRNA-degrading endonuclease RelE of RelBE toxin-antitoxin system